jgi:hypothetical protein
MIRRIALAAVLTAAMAGPSMAQDASVADRPALTTKSTQDLIKQRETWGTAPSKSAAPAAAPAAKAAAPAAAKAAGAAAPAAAAAAVAGSAVAGRPALPTTSTADLIKERETWGKAPAGKAATLKERAKAAGTKVKEKASKAYQATKKAVKKAVNKVRGKQG